MSLSKEERLENIALALKLMLRELEGQAIDSKQFEIDTETFKEVEQSTWRELESNYLIKPMNVIGTRMYEFTGSGWRIALDLVWEQNKDMLEATLAKLSAAFKDKVKGRQEDAYVYFDSLAAETGIPEGWLYNIIESDIIGYRFNIKSVGWDLRQKSMIRIPLDYGLRPL